MPFQVEDARTVSQLAVRCRDAKTPGHPASPTARVRPSVPCLCPVRHLHNALGRKFVPPRFRVEFTACRSRISSCPQEKKSPRHFENDCNANNVSRYLVPQSNHPAKMSKRTKKVGISGKVCNSLAPGNYFGGRFLG